jgi:hypothetical protein
MGETKLSRDAPSKERLSPNRASPIEDAVFVSVQHGNATLSDIMDGTTYLRPQVRAALRRLVEKRLVLRDGDHWSPTG